MCRGHLGIEGAYRQLQKDVCCTLSFYTLPNSTDLLLVHDMPVHRCSVSYTHTETATRYLRCVELFHEVQDLLQVRERERLLTPNR